MRSLLISQRLLGFFLVNITILIIIVANSYMFTNNSVVSLKTIKNNTLPISSIYTDNLYLLERIINSFIDASVTNEKEILENILELKQRIDKNFVSLKKYSVETQEDEKMFSKYFDFAYTFSLNMLNDKHYDLKDAQTLQIYSNDISLLFEKNNKMYKENLHNSLKNISDDTGLYFVNSLVTSGIGLFIIFVLGIYLYRLVRYRFNNILTLVENLTKEKPDFSIRINTDGDDEIDRLIKHFNKLSDKLEKEHNKSSALLLREIEETQKEVIFTMGSIGESRSKETGNHVKRVAEYSKLLAVYYGLSETDAEMLKQASPMHDIGKVAIADNVLNKPGRFNAEERKIMDQHVILGHEMLKYSNRPLLKTASIVALEHHEKYDGTGYPNAKKGKDIHIFGRITALADVFDALGSERVYKKAWSDEKIFKFFQEERAKHFDPVLIDIFFDNLNEFLKIRDRFKDK